MLTFEVKDMHCGHCVSTITQSLKATDRDARVQIDLATHRVQVQPVSANAEALAQAIQGAGYTPVPVDAAVRDVAASAPRPCCGHCQ